MNIKKNCEYILGHPYTRRAAEEFIKGNTELMSHLLFEIHYHTFDKTALHCSKVYGLNKWNNSCAIKDILRSVEPPSNLSILLPTIIVDKNSDKPIQDI
jgi:hypothetical protein